MGRYVERSLPQGEQIIWSTHVTWWKLVILWVCSICAVTFSVGAIIFTLNMELDLLLTILLVGLFGLIALIPALEAIISTIIQVQDEYVLTTRRIVDKKGVFNITYRSVPLDMCTTAEPEISFLGRIFKFGTVKIYTASSEKPALELKDIYGAEAFTNAIMEYRATGRRKEWEFADEKASKEVEQLRERNQTLLQRERARRAAAMAYRRQEAERLKNDVNKPEEEPAKQKPKLW